MPRLFSHVTFALCLLGVASAALAQTPNPPRGLIATANPDNSVTLRWAPPIGGGGVTGYLVEVGDSSGLSNVTTQQLGDVANFEFLPGVLTPGATYFFRVRAFNGSGVSAPSQEVQATVTCNPPDHGPTYLTWRALSAAIQLTWVPVNGVTHYRAEIGASPGAADVVAGMTTHSWMTLAVPAAGTYYARVYASNVCGEGPATPDLTVLAATPTPSTTVVVNEFNTFLELKNISTTVVDIANWGIQGTGGNSQVVSRLATIPDGATLAPGCTYLVSTRADPLTQGMLFDHTLFSLIQDGVAIVRPDGMVVDSAGRRIFDVGMHPESPYIEGQGLPSRPVSPGVQSFARAADLDTNNNVADFIPLATATPQNSRTCLVGVPPGPPLNLAANVQGATVTLSWVPPPIGGVQSVYRLEAGTAPGLSNAGLFDLAPHLTSITFDGVPNGTYYGRLRAINNAGISPPSNEVVLTVCGSGCTPPRPVAQLTWQGSGHSLLLQWIGPNSGVPPTGYLVEAGSAPGLADYGQVPTGSTAEFVIFHGVPSGTYYARVRALNGATPGPASNEVTVIVP